MKKYLFLIFTALIFLGCSQKEVVVPIVEKPNYSQNDSIRKIKISYIKNDTINLKQNLIKQMYDVNNVVPSYFNVNAQHPTAFMKGTVTKNIKTSVYKKTVPVQHRKPACIYKFYPCKSVNNKMFCKKTPAFTMPKHKFDKIKKKLYSNKHYIIYKKNIYRIVKDCVPTKAVIICEKREINISADIKITDRKDNILFQNEYYAKKTDDPCSRVNMYQNQKKYSVNTTINDETERISWKISKQIVNDIAPHISYFRAVLYSDPDVELNSQDESMFCLTNEDISDSDKLKIYQTLYKKYPQSCVITYNYSIYLVKFQKYQKAKKLLTKITNSQKCNEDLKHYSYRILSILETIY